MQAYIARRLIYGAFTALLVTMIIFVIMRIAPGDVSLMIAAQQIEEGQEIDQDLVERVREELGLDRPLVVQYLVWLKGMVTLDWGESLFVQRSVWGDFTRKVPFPVCEWTQPSVARNSYAATTVCRLTPSCRARSRVGGNRCPGPSRPSSAEARTSCAICR